MSGVRTECYVRWIGEEYFVRYDRRHQKKIRNELNNVRLQLVVKLYGSLVNESGKSVTSHAIFRVVYSCTVKRSRTVSCHRKPRASAVGEISMCNCDGANKTSWVSET
jgi:ABC-type dipeptide/oligopeptide/nickel transport system ATPase component